MPMKLNYLTCYSYASVRNDFLGAQRVGLDTVTHWQFRTTQLQGRGVIKKLLDPSCDAEHVSTNIGIRRT